MHTAWQISAADPERAASLARELAIRPLTAQLLLNRHVEDPALARRFLDPRLADLRPPAAMAGFARAVDRLAAALEAHETIGIFGDYDVDGLTTCALLARYLLDLGGRVVARVARRNAGYGFGVADADAFADAGCTLIITGDCGTSDVDAIARARTRNADVIVVDHHQVPDRDPGAYAMLNPHQPGCGFPFKGLASVGVAFYLACALRTLLRARGPRAADLPDPRDLLDLVAVGTVADLAPLTDENRVLVSAGLRELRRARRPGLRALGEVAGLDLGRPLTSADIGFKLGPRLNAPGRLGDAQLALDLLLAPDAATGLAAAYACEEVNQRRRTLQDAVHAEAVALVDAAPPGRAIVVAGEGWPPGVVGIVAAKLVDRYGRPSVVIALDGDQGRGSARTTGPTGLNLYQALKACAPHLQRYGGHAAAAGLTIARADLPAFAQAFEAHAVKVLEGAPEGPRLPVEAEVELGEIDELFADELQRLGPFGVGNPEPLLAARGLAVDHTRVVGERHLQITLRGGTSTLDGIAFGQAESDPGQGARVRAAFYPELDHWNGRARLRLRVQELASDGEEA